MATGKHQGLLPTLIVLLVVAGAATIIGIVIWLRMAPKGVPTQPGRPTTTLQLPQTQHPNRNMARAVLVC